MARRSGYTREELRERAIEAGQGIIAAQGFSGFSARQVAKEIGYTIGTIYNIFESHDDLILHINAVTLQDMAAFIENKTKKKQEGAAAIKTLAAAYIAFAEGNYNRWSALFEHNLPKGEALPGWYQHHVKTLFGMVERHFLPVTAYSKKKAEIAAKTIWASIHGICQLSLTGKLDTVGVSSIKTLTNSLIDSYMRGLVA